jgi:hypothetical protein
MSEACLTDPPVTVAEFDMFLDAQRDDARWELVAGRICAMTNPTEDQEQIAGNIGAPPKLAMDTIGCRPYQGGMGDRRFETSEVWIGHDPTLLSVAVHLGAEISLLIR